MTITTRPPASDEDRGARALLDAAGKALADMPGERVPAGFPALLFARAAPEDLVAYQPHELAALASEAWAFLASASRARRRSASSRRRRWRANG